MTGQGGSLRVEEAGQVFVDPAAYADDRRFHEGCTVLRRESPVHRVDVPAFNPFWAVTKHADVLEVEKQNTIFLNAPRPLLQMKEFDYGGENQSDPLRTLIHMDEPDHKAYREITADWFQGPSVRQLQTRISELAGMFVEKMAELGGECDFVNDVAAHYPLYVILSLLGLPETDFPKMLKFTQELFGATDPDRGRGITAEERMAVLPDFFAYFGELTESRRATATNDLASVIANAHLEGELLQQMDVLSYYVIIATAGHDTTSSTIAGGLQALIEFPDQLERLRDDPNLMSSGAEEMIRWVTPVKHFMRTATVDYELRGVKIAAGESLLLSYPSANRDEEVFEEPFQFDVGRNPNRHLAFGFGAHYCLGAQLAKMEIRALFAELLRRLEHIELAGTPARTETLFVGGLKRLPIRYKLR